ncbi:acyl-CoA N-acyltransferase [Mucor mucedo]|uniref:acyl-CoA N-acyltransferase n=1 Tax=Mucor mucedo TaxID=29922 RepID=UPI00221EA60A|nr:acyl-CoA N-acyltransferase [Mucor mucedo]KAI7886395.1 acyl-CoA N-acyltransferase [Mucor mucedo]
MTASSFIVVRPVLCEDTRYNSKVWEMINAAYRSSESWTTDVKIVSIPRISLDELNETVLNSGKENVLMYAFDEENVAGCILIKKDGTLSLLAVSPSYQSRGIGGLLIKESLDYMKSVLCMKLAIIHVFQCRPELIAWYQRLGFEDDGEVMPFPFKNILLVDEAPLVVLKNKLF